MKEKTNEISIVDNRDCNDFLTRNQLINLINDFMKSNNYLTIEFYTDASNKYRGFGIVGTVRTLRINSYNINEDKDILDLVKEEIDKRDKRQNRSKNNCDLPKHSYLLSSDSFIPGGPELVVLVKRVGKEMDDLRREEESGTYQKKFGGYTIKD
jgi:hypothetical protein